MDINLCTDYHFLEGLRIVKFMITILKIVIPILLVGFGAYDYMQSVLNPDKNSLANQTKKLAMRITSALLIFLLPTIISVVFNLLENFSDIAYVLMTCSGNAEEKIIKELKNAEKERLNALNYKSNNYVAKYDSSKYVLKKSSSSGESSMYSFIMNYEGHTDYCDSAGTKYKAVDIGDGAATIGYGITNHIFDVKVGDCIDTQIVDDYFMKHVDEKKTMIENLVKSTNITDWDDAKSTAAISLAYNCGDSYGQKLVQSYAASGNDGALGVFKSCTHAGNGNDAFTEGLKTRRDGEYELFTTGNYDIGFYERQRKYIP